MVTPLLLGLDIGTSRIKAVVMDRAGHEVGVFATPTPWTRREMAVGALRAALGLVLDALGDFRREVVALGIAGVAESGAPLDVRDRALAPVIAWHDPRGADVVARLVGRFGDDLARWIGQPVRTVSSVAKLGWLAEQGVRGVSCWLGVPELALNRLTGSRVTEYSLAARTGWYHVGGRHYLPEVAQAAGIEPGVFPSLQPAGAVMGLITPGGAAWSGLPPGIPVTVAGHDHLVGRLGSGAGPADLVNSVGTAETVVATTDVLPDRDRALTRRVALTVMPGGEGWALLASAARAGIILSSVAERLGRSPAELDRLAEGAGVVDAAGLVARGGATAGDGEEPLPDAAPGAIWNGVLRALSQRTWEAASRIAEVVRPASGLVVFGGGSRSAPWLAEKARLGWLPVKRSTAAEAVARGAALYAGVAAGWWPTAGTGPHAAIVGATMGP